MASFGDPNSHLMQAGRAVGIEFTNDRNAYPTIKAHALMEYVKESMDNDTANKLMELMFERYFVGGENINDENKLLELLAKCCSVSEDQKEQAKQSMLDRERQTNVKAKDYFYKSRMRVSGVPFFVIGNGDRPVGFSGAQPADMIAEVLQEQAEESEE